MSKYLNTILAIVIATIVVLIINARHKEHLLKQDYDRLTAKYGALDVEDEDQFQITFVPDENSRHQYVWRVFQPEMPNGLSTLIKSHGGTGGDFGNSPVAQKELRIFVKIRVMDGVPKLYYQIGGNSSVRTLGRDFGKFIADHIDRLDIQIMAKSGTEIVARTEKIRLISIRIPEDLFDDLPEEDLSDHELERCKNEPLLEITIGDALIMKDDR